MPPEKVILDTNIFVSLAINRNTRFIVDINSSSKFQLIICDELLAELREVIQRPKFRKNQIDIMVLELLIRRFSENYKIKEHSVNLPDPDDNFLVNLALSSQTKIIVTGDKLLLKLDTYLGVSFISFSRFSNMVL